MLVCQNPMRFDDYATAWVAENRLPSFVDLGGGTLSQGFEQKIHEGLSVGISLFNFTTIMI